MNSPLDLPSLKPTARDRGATPAAEPSNGGAQLPATDVSGGGDSDPADAPRRSGFARASGHRDVSP